MRCTSRLDFIEPLRSIELLHSMVPFKYQVLEPIETLDNMDALELSTHGNTESNDVTRSNSLWVLELDILVKLLP